MCVQKVVFLLSLSLIYLSFFLSHRRGRENAENVWTAKNLKARKDKKKFFDIFSRPTCNYEETVRWRPMNTLLP